jgi:phosphonate C-P lyase system protein PhnG
MDKTHASAEGGSGGGVKGRLLAVVEMARDEEVAWLLDRLWASGRFRVKRPPRTGLVMATVLDPFDTAFHLGEVLVTEAQVETDGKVASGMILGDAPQKALLLAAVEAAEPSAGTELRAVLDEFIDRLEGRSAAAAQRISRLVAATAVTFESMKKESVDFGSLGD